MLAEVIPAKPEPITTTSYSGLRPARKSFGIAKSGERAESKDRNADERGRTSTAICIRPLDPESSASANSATSATIAIPMGQGEYNKTWGGSSLPKAG